MLLFRRLGQLFRLPRDGLAQIDQWQTVSCLNCLHMSGAAVATPANILNIAFRLDNCMHNVIQLQKSQKPINPLYTGKPLNFLYFDKH